jgi:hypothetical protein
MTLRRIGYAALAAFLLVPFTACNLAAFDADGDGTVTRQEFVTAIMDFFCGDEEPAPAQVTDSGTIGGTPNESGTTDGGTTDQGIPQ